MAVPGNAVTLDVGTMLATWMIALGRPENGPQWGIPVCPAEFTVVRRGFVAHVRL